MNTIDNNMRLGGFAGFDQGPVPAASVRPGASGPDTGLSVGMAPAASLDGLEEVDPAVDAALTRDDDLGRLMAGVFDLPAPPMPDFT